MKKLLKLGIGNAKLKNDVAIFDLPAGHFCPFAKDCGEKVNPKTGKLIFNPKAKFRCFAATSELISSAARRKRWHNANLIKACTSVTDIANLIIASFEANSKTAVAPKVRVHSSGDFFSQKYFDAWMKVAKAMPNKTFYTYTKSFKFWIKRLNEVPTNFHLTASKGSKHDELIALYDLKNVELVFSEAEAKKKRLQIDHDDSHCYNRRVKKFALLIHGTQPAGSPAMRAIMELRKQGISGYHRGSKAEKRTGILV